MLNCQKNPNYTDTPISPAIMGFFQLSPFKYPDIFLMFLEKSKKNTTHQFMATSISYLFSPLKLRNYDHFFRDIDKIFLLKRSLT